jgi:NAD-dependent dihydropyrimidine dehydrogenase PreA subunit
MTDLYEQLASNVMAQGSKYIPRLFAIIADEDEARLLLAMPETAPQLAEKTGFPVEQVESMLKKLFQKGLAFYSKRTDPPTWRMCRDVGQFHDASILWPEASHEFFDIWQEYMETEWLDAMEMLGEALPHPSMRVIPIDMSVEAKHQILASEDVTQIIKDARRIAVVKCPCRLSAQKCDAPLEACIQLNRAADYAMERGTGRELNKKEALELLRQCQEAGLIHMTMNRKSVEHVICNCCSCCCITMPALIQRGAKTAAPSRYLAVIDSDACSVCGICEDRCGFEAISIDDEAAVVDAEKCFGCGVCAASCPEEAIQLSEIRQPTYVPD